jgi:uncharacterized protein
MNLDDIIAIDFHTHAEEPCNCHRDDGYNEFQAGMAAYFKNPAGIDGMLPTVPQTAAYYRERKIAAVIFGVDAERETGFYRHNNEEIAELAAANSDILIPFASIDPAKGKLGARSAAAGARLRRQGVQVPSHDAGLFSQRPDGLSAL